MGTFNHPKTTSLPMVTEPSLGCGKGEEGFAPQNQDSHLENANLKGQDVSFEREAPLRGNVPGPVSTEHGNTRCWTRGFGRGQ